MTCLLLVRSKSFIFLSLEVFLQPNQTYTVVPFCRRGYRGSEKGSALAKAT